MPERKHVVIGITGGIAAYKSLFLIRLFRKQGYEVQVVATANALQFVTPLSIETLSQNRLYADTFERTSDWDVRHVSVAQWADCIVVAPATANIIGKCANGIADDALSTLLLATKRPVFMAPAMNDNMFSHPAVQQNLQTLQQRGCHIISPQSGFLACGSNGTGRMEDPERIFDTVSRFLDELTPRSIEKTVDPFFDVPKSNHLKTCLTGKKVMITAGPTYEPIDPVRFVGNYSSGLMGFCLAESAAERGAEVTLVTGPTCLKTAHPNIKRIDVVTAGEMYRCCMDIFKNQDLMVMAAAVADYTPVNVASEKIKKQSDTIQLSLKKTPDILYSVGQMKGKSQTLVGFALETENEIDNALHKLHTKNADYIVLNSLRDKDAGFRTATNKVRIISKDGHIVESELKDKKSIADDIIDFVTNNIK